MKIRNKPTKQYVLEQIKNGLLQFPPLKVKPVPYVRMLESERGNDAVLAVEWEGQSFLFRAEYKSKSTPREFQNALSEIHRYSSSAQLLPLLLMPFLSESQLTELTEQHISGLDLSGNGVIIVSGRIFVYRTGYPNLYPSSATIQNIYRRDTSIVARSFLICPFYDSVNRLYDFIKKQSRSSETISLSTISKALKSLEEDIIVHRDNSGIRLVQPEKLLEKLVTNYRPPTVQRFLIGKADDDRERLMQHLLANSIEHNVDLVGTGIGSMARYAVMAREDILSVYCRNQSHILGGIEFQQSKRFPNLEVIETQEKSVYFDIQDKGGFFWASPIQSYLELMAGDQRDKDTADQIRAAILNQITEKRYE